MLMQIRERASGVLTYIIVSFIALTFALWGVQEYFTGPSDAVVAEVNGEEIPKRFFDFQLQQQRRYLRSLLGESYNTLYADETKLKLNVIDTLIENQILDDVTIDAGYRISNRQVFERISEAPEFQVNGRFDRTRYENLLAAQNRSAVEIEEQLRQSERVQQFQNGILVTSFLPNGQKKNFASLKNEKRQFDYIIVNQTITDDTVSEDEISAYYQANQSAFKTLPRVKLEYLEIKQEDIAAEISFAEEELRAAYEDEITRYSTAELRKPSHILFKLTPEANAEQIADAFEKATKAAKRIKAGESFAVVAQEVSEDSISAKRGGDLGFIGRADLNNPEFIDKLFTMEVGAISEPVRTQLGVQLIHLEEITASKAKPFADVRAQVLAALQADSAEAEFVQQAEKLQDLSYQHADTLAIAADEIGMEIKTTDWVERLDSEGIASYPKVYSVAFSEEVLKSGVNSELIEISDGHVAVVRVAEYQEATVQPLDDVRDRIIGQIVNQKSRAASKQKGEQIVEQLQASPTSIGDIVKDNNLELASPAAVLRNDNSIDESILELAFKLPSEQGSLPVVVGAQLDELGYVVLKLNNIVAAQGDDLVADAAEWNSTLSNYGRRELAAIKRSLRETENVRIFEENL